MPEEGCDIGLEFRALREDGGEIRIMGPGDRHGKAFQYVVVSRNNVCS